MRAALALGLAALLLLCSCTIQPTDRLALLTAGDLASAEALATAAQDTGQGSGADCWSFLAGLMPALPAVVGVATTIELARIPRLPAAQEKCGAVLPPRIPGTVP